jgi:AbrB family looped-hinge helix DNA binding protein
MIVKLSSKGQVVIPAKARKALRLRPGSRLDAEVRDGTVILAPIPDDPIEAGFGMFRNGKDSAVRTLLEMRREDDRRLAGKGR